MIIDRKIQPFIVFTDDGIGAALNKINTNRARIVFGVDEHGCLVGSLSDGDFRRWILNQSEVDLDSPVAEALNRTTSYCSIDDEPTAILSTFTAAKTIIPLLDAQRRVAAVARGAPSGIVIGDRYIDELNPCFVIAEIGNNHNGSLRLALELIDLCADAGVDCCKFQMRHMETLYGDGFGRQSSDLGMEYTLDLLNRFQLSDDELLQCLDHCMRRGVIPLCTPWDQRSVDVLEEYGVPGYKIASADLTNHDLLEGLVATGKPLICSTGMSTEAEIRQSAQFLRGRGATFILLHCNSTYPAPFKDINLRYLERLKAISGGVVGYSGHERGYSPVIAAVALGAKVIEKHVTVDRTMEGNDHKVSLLPDELRQMVVAIREVEASLGSDDGRIITQGEMMNREVLAKSLCVTSDVAIGEPITRDVLGVRSPGQGLQPCHMDLIVGRKAKRNLSAGDILFASDANNQAAQPRSYAFRRPFGIPVRYHDYDALTRETNVDFVEFHLSYRDLEIDPAQLFDRPQEIDFVVHSPELFSGDHILDLCANDKEYRLRSIKELGRVADITRRLKASFPRTQRPMIVVNAGGHSKSHHLCDDIKPELYRLVAESLAQIDQDGVEFIIQTMPPYPWHFGGQSYHNLFVDPEQIMNFYQQHGVRICLDTSHSKLACNHYQQDFNTFVELIAPACAHLHIADAKGSDGEGLQIGQGDIDLKALADILDHKAPLVPFIPEIWQGHKNSGEGFWVALDTLEAHL